MRESGKQDDRGSATVEQVGIVLLLALVFAGLVAVGFFGRDGPPGHGLGIRIANRIACGPREPGSCRQHPTVAAYGRDMARAVRWLAPVASGSVSGSGKLLVPVDFRYCRRSSCAVSTGDGRLSTANRRLTLFTEVLPLGDGSWSITYWSYRPTIGWAATRRVAGPAEIKAASGTRLSLDDSPRLVPLEILPGRNHYDFPPGETPPWRWRVKSASNGWST